MEERWRRLLMLVWLVLCVGQGNAAYEPIEPVECRCYVSFYTKFATSCNGYSSGIGSTMLNGYAGEDYQTLSGNPSGDDFLYKFTDCHTLELQERPHLDEKPEVGYQHAAIKEGGCERFRESWVAVSDCEESSDGLGSEAWLPIIGTSLLVLVGLSASVCICMHTRAEREGYDTVLAPVPSYCDNESNIIEDGGDGDGMPVDEWMDPDPRLTDGASTAAPSYASPTHSDYSAGRSGLGGAHPGPRPSEGHFYPPAFEPSPYSP